MGGFLTPPTFTPPVAPIPLGTNNQVLTMVAGVPRFAAAGGGSGTVLGAFVAVTLAAGTTNNLNPAPVGPPVWPTGYGRVDLNSAAGDATITGLVAGSDGQVILLRNSGANTVTLANQNAGSSAANRFVYAASLILPPGASVLATYYNAATGINGGAGGWVLR